MRVVRAGIQYYHTPGGNGMSDPSAVMDKRTLRNVGKVLALIPQGVYVMTTRHEQRSRAVLVSWVQQASFSPPMVMVALRKGRDIVPMLHDSHAFALCQLSAKDTLTFKKLRNAHGNEETLRAMTIDFKKTGAPVLKNCLAWLDCELVRHIDVDGDHDLYIGLILDGAVNDRNAKPMVHLRDNGLKY